MHTHTHTHKHTQIYANTHTHLSVEGNHENVCAHKHTHAQQAYNTHTHTHTHAHTHTLTTHNIETHTYTHTHTHTTVFGKHCECIAQKCTHLERLPPLASHLLLPSHCVFTRHGGKKIDSRSLCIISRIRNNTLDQDSRIYQLSYSNGRTQWVVLYLRDNAD